MPRKSKEVLRNRDIISDNERLDRQFTQLSKENVSCTRLVTDTVRRNNDFETTTTTTTVECKHNQSRNIRKSVNHKR